LGRTLRAFQLETISLIGTNIRDLSPLEGLSNLRGLGLFIGLVEDISPLAGLTSLDVLDLSSNYVRDIRPLLANEGLGAGDVVSVQANCLDVSVGSESMSVIEELTRRGVEVHYKTQRQDCDE
jgi:hypothetical protein